jgi:hypothetical protein
MRRKKAKAKTFGPCHFQCGRQATHKGAQTCDPCYQALYYWMKKGVRAVMHRQRQLGVFRRRMEALSNARDITEPVRKRA